MKRDYYQPQKKGEIELFTIDEYPVDGVYLIFEEGMHFSVIYCLCFVKEVLIVMLEEKSREERDPNLEVEGVSPLGKYG